MDTYASLLYRLGKKDEAIETQIKALEILKSRGESTVNLETTLAKIKNGTLEGDLNINEIFNDISTLNFKK